MKVSGSAKALALVLLMALLVGDGWQLVTASRCEVLAANGPAQQQQQQHQTSGKTVEPANQTAASPTGGTTTGLFTTLSGRTLRRSEFTLGFSWNNFDRDPGDLDITQVPVSLTFGLTNRLEMFASITFFQQVTSRQPFALSGYQFNGVRSAFGGDPFVAFGAPSGELNGAGVFPFSGAALGGVLPPLGSFFGPAIITDRPGFYNDFPFFGPASFSGGGFNLRRSANGTGDVTLGMKWAITDPDSRFNLAAAGFVRVPTAKSFHALANGRGAGVTDYGVMFISGQNYAGNRVRFVQNLGYVHSGDPERNGVKLLNRRDQLLANIGVELSPAQQLVLTSEWANTIYVGQGTPSLNSINPSDLLLGARFFGWDGRIQVGGAWRRLLNQSNGRTIPVFIPGQGVRGFDISSSDPNGFVLNLGIARRASLIPPPAPNRAPTVALLVDRTEVREGDQVRIEARAVDPDNDVVTYSWSVEPRTLPPTMLRAEGMPVGTPLGDKIVADTRGVNPTPGALPVTVTITVTVDDGRGGTASDSRTITVASQPAAPPTPVTPTPTPTPPPQPPPNRAPVIQSIEISPIGTPRVTGQITDGDLLRIRAVASDPDGDVLVYRWTSSAGRRTGIGSEITLDTTGVTPAPGQTPVALTVTLTVDDGRGGTDSDSRTINVVPARRPEAIPQPTLIFTRANVARITNIHKAVLDEVAEALKLDPRATLVIDGHQDRPERAGVARTRARNAAAYLSTQRGIDRSRITVRNFGATRPHPSGQTRLNRRVEMWLVPVGAELPPNHAVPRERIPSAAQRQRQLRQPQPQQLQQPQPQPQQQQARPPQPQPQPPRQQLQQQQQPKPQPQQQQKPPQPQQQAKPPQPQPQSQPQQQQKPPQPTTQQQKKPSPAPQKKPGQQPPPQQKKPQSQQPQQQQPQQKQQPKPEPKKPQAPASSPTRLKEDNAVDGPLVTAHRRGLRVSSVSSEASPMNSADSQLSKRGAKSPSRSTKKSPRQIARR